MTSRLFTVDQEGNTLSHAPGYVANVLDNFNRADGALGANWGRVWFAALDLTISGSGVISTGAFNWAANYWTQIQPADQEAFLSVVSRPFSGQAMSLLLRVYNVGQKAYHIAWWNDNAYIMYTHGPTPTFTILASLSNREVNPGDLIRARVVGNVISMIQNGVAILTYTDASNLVPGPGYIGIGMVDFMSTGKADDFGGGWAANIQGRALIVPSEVI